MKYSDQILARLFALLLRLYPRRHREEYEQEMRWVFQRTIDEAAQQGNFALTGLALRELRDLPAAILVAHRRMARRRNMVKGQRSCPAFEAGAWHEALVAMAPFLLVGMLPALLSLLNVSFVHTRSMGTLVSGLVVLSVILCIIGLIRGLPRWILPYGGMILFLLALFSTRVFRGLLGRLCAALVSPDGPWFLRQAVSTGQIWAGMLLAELALILLIIIIPPVCSVLERMRRDWTLLSFGIYGSAIFALMLEFDEYVHHEPYLLTAMVILVVCGWLYLHGTRAWQRLLSLLAGVTLAMAIAAVGKAIVYAGSGWPHPRLSTPQTEAVRTVITWGWLGITTVVPAVIAFLPHPDRRPVAGEA
jgi:hypothetical protein